MTGDRERLSVKKIVKMSCGIWRMNLCSIITFLVLHKLIFVVSDFEHPCLLALKSIGNRSRMLNEKFKVKYTLKNELQSKSNFETCLSFSQSLVFYGFTYSYSWKFVWIRNQLSFIEVSKHIYIYPSWNTTGQLGDQNNISKRHVH